MTLIIATIADAVERLGGTGVVSKLLTERLGKPYSVSRVSNYKSGIKPDRETFPVFYRALAEIDCIPDPALWGLDTRNFELALDTAAGLSAFYPEIRRSMSPVATLARLSVDTAVDSAREAPAKPIKQRRASRTRDQGSFEVELAMTG